MISTLSQLTGSQFYLCSSLISLAEASPPEGLELPLGEEGRVWSEAGSEIRGAATHLCQDISSTFLQVGRVLYFYFFDIE